MGGVGPPAVEAGRDEYVVEWWHVYGCWWHRPLDRRGFTPALSRALSEPPVWLWRHLRAGLSFRVQLFVFGMATLATTFGCAADSAFPPGEVEQPDQRRCADRGDGLVTGRSIPSQGRGRSRSEARTGALSRRMRPVDQRARVRVRAVEGCKVVVQVAPSTERRSS